MSRHPYTYAADFIRALAGYDATGTKLSRSDAASIRQGIAKAIGMDEHDLACKLADYYLEHEKEIGEKAAQEFLSARSPA